ncbi:MAG: acetolactate synthase small subunit [Bacillota bacterium]|jgi:acetolactate synthase-1/3 small subunit|nr:acetolactate synthase small subunit [Bacillota bacterium]HHU43707.1 acetolactate synthase small subunit [Clostridiales bacterium]
MKKERFVLSLLVRNESGVLTRISGLFARRGFNIDSLSVGETLDKGISRMTITAVGDDYIQTQITRQLEKLHDVLIVEIMDSKNTVEREIMLIKVNVAQGSRTEILEAISIFRAKVVDFSPTSLTVEITGETSKCEAFVEYLKPYGIAELCRTGITAISRGCETLKNKIKGE